jgi:hypothetical protein
MAGMGTPCVLCGLVPTRTVKIRRNVGLLVLRSGVTFEKPLCKVHGRQVAREYLIKTLLFGWWGLTSFFINLTMVSDDVKAFGAFRDLAEPSAVGSAPAKPMMMPKAFLESIPHVTPHGEWQPDPYVRHQYRWLVQSEWSDQVCDDGRMSVDPPGWATPVNS